MLRYEDDSVGLHLLEWFRSVTVTTVQYRSNASLEPRYRSNTDRELANVTRPGPNSRDISSYLGTRVNLIYEGGDRERKK